MAQKGSIAWYNEMAEKLNVVTMELKTMRRASIKKRIASYLNQYLLSKAGSCTFRKLWIDPVLDDRTTALMVAINSIWECRDFPKRENPLRMFFNDRGEPNEYANKISAQAPKERSTQTGKSFEDLWGEMKKSIKPTGWNQKDHGIQ